MPVTRFQKSACPLEIDRGASIVGAGNERLLAAKVIQEDIISLDTQIIEHREYGLIHHGWAAHVILAVLGRWMIAQIVLIKHIVNKARLAVPILQVLIRERDVPSKVRIICSQFIELINIKEFPLVPSAVPKRDLSVCFDPQ